MAIEITVPRLGWTMEEGTFLGWLKRDGESVREGEALFTLEGDKAAQDVPATDAGILRVPEGAPGTGDTVRVGALLGHLLAPGEVFVSGTGGRPAPSPSAESPSVPATIESVAAPDRASPSLPGAPAPSAIRISPRAARAAAALGVDWTALRGTGSTGRIRERDVVAAANGLQRRDPTVPGDGAPPRMPGRGIPVGTARRTIARRMAAGVHEAAPVTLTIRADATQLVRARAESKDVATADRPAPSLDDLFVKLVATALQEHPLLNSQWHGDTVFLPDEINIAVAIDTEHGLVAPVIRNVPGLDLHQIAAASRAMIRQARAGRLGREQLEGGTFTLTNLGGLGIETFTPILNLPQSAVLGIGRIAPEPVVVGGEVVVRDVVPLSLTFDHRAMDGAPAARFLETLRELLAKPPPRPAP